MVDSKNPPNPETTTLPANPVQHLTQEPPVDRVLIVDTETTDLDIQRGQVIEVGAILYSVKHRTALQECSTLIPADSNPAAHINRIKETALRNITVELTHRGLAMLTDMAREAELVVAHNAQFDKKWFGLPKNDEIPIPTLFNANGQPLSWVCTCHDFEWPKQTRPGQSLVHLALAHDIGVSTAHRALTDCQLIAALFDRMENLEEMFERALRPKARFKAVVSYDDRNLAKQAGFQWFDERKSWERIMAVEDSQRLPFGVQQLEQTEFIARQLGHLKPNTSFPS
ncbi:3'-5' exonuclease [Phormidium sp. CCY1219]|uniref:3'-5' exonuclease n=1 Tax=Phormidium sp. CCY1219 TaxID=2886104 RepID=UPI002D1EE8CD|nr:3'-5' exonuclease [Phormidium sp. CCY1219]MEB3826425.1 3'-5' exonuclease [Phormidium sp. CCY1219]